MDFEDPESGLDFAEEESFDINNLEDEIKEIEGEIAKQDDLESPNESSRSVLEHPSLPDNSLGLDALKKQFSRQPTGELEQPPTYFPVVIRKVAKRAKKVSKKVASLDTLEEGRSLDYETALGDFKRNTKQVEMMICVTMYNEPFEQVKDSLTGVIRNIAELLDVQRERFCNSIAIAIIADGYDRVDEDFLLMAEQ